jgi:hypothetical protein
MRGLTFFTRDTSLKLLRALLYAAILGSAVQILGLPWLGGAIMAAAAAMFIVLLAVLIEHSRRCLD